MLAGMCAASFAALVNADWPMPGQGNEAAVQGYGGTIHHPGQDSSENSSLTIFIAESVEREVEERYSTGTENNSIINTISGEILEMAEVTNAERVVTDFQNHSQPTGTVTALNHQVRSEVLSIPQKTVSPDSQPLPTSSVPKPELHVMLLVGLGLIVLSLRRRTHFTHR